MTSFSWIWRFQHLKILGKLYSSHVLCPNVTIFLKNVCIFKDWTLKKIILKGWWFRGGSDEKMMRMWFGLEINVVGLPPLVEQTIFTPHLNFEMQFEFFKLSLRSPYLYESGTQQCISYLTRMTRYNSIRPSALVIWRGWTVIIR